MPFSFLTLEVQLIAAAIYSTMYIISEIKVWRHSRHTDVKLLPTVSGGHWLWGHEKEAFEAPNGQFYIDNFRKHGRAFAMKGALLHSDILAIADPAAVAHVLSKDAFAYHKADATRPLIGNQASRSLAWTEDQQHQRQRATLAPLFTNEAIKAMSQTIHDTAQKLVTTLRHHVYHNTDTRSGPSSTTTINTLDWTFAATLTVIGIVGLGYDFQLGINNADAVAIHIAWRQIAQYGTTFVAFLLPLITRAFPFTLLAHLPVKAVQAHGETEAIIHRRALNLIAEKQNPHECDGDEKKKGSNFLNTLLQTRPQNPHVGHSYKDILEHVSTLILGGHEKTASTISHALYALAHNRPAQDQLRDELLNFERSPPPPTGFAAPSEPSYDDFLKRLPVLDAVCNETLRMYPSVMKSTRVAVLDDLIPLRFPIVNPKTGRTLTSIRIKAGQTVEIHHMAINQSQDAWGPDAAEWKPERWISCKGSSAIGSPPSPRNVSHGWNGMMSFLEGPRTCIGLRLALFECKIIISELIKAFEFLPDAKVENLSSATTLTTPHIMGNGQDGMQIPVRVRCL
ncbi:hypothetical protein FRB96_004406 [Tulasnella sp. 330]|nr:hypothetical protein FRB96_004406 [Tulasnella sp. 330]KAG8884525.1 hypothetical protein FRB97_004038 [Tulasnella sp. 331]KAG8889473.1 hypothetical protein FRB98_004158 [Tulasnella sp. 332]